MIKALDLILVATVTLIIGFGVGAAVEDCYNSGTQRDYASELVLSQQREQQLTSDFYEMRDRLIEQMQRNDKDASTFNQCVKANKDWSAAFAKQKHELDIYKGAFETIRKIAVAQPAQFVSPATTK